MESQDRNQFDDLLDGALKQYSSVEPRAGLEGRVLARLAAADRRPQWWARWAWGLAGAGAAVLVIAMWFGHGIRVTTHNGLSPQAAHKVPAPPDRGTPAQEASQHKESSSRRNHHMVTAVLARNPRLEQFPTPRPVSDQERMLINYVQRYPEEAKLVIQEQDEFERERSSAEQRIESTSTTDKDER